MQVKRKSLAAFVASMVIFGTIGILRRMIPLPSEALSFARGVLGSIFLLLVLKGSGRRFDAAEQSCRQRRDQNKARHAFYIPVKLIQCDPTPCVVQKFPPCSSLFRSGTAKKMSKLKAVIL